MSTATMGTPGAEAPPLGIIPRDYQADAFIAILREFDRGTHSTALILPTGCGKTVTFGMVAKERIEDQGKRVLIVAHRGELITQAANAMATLGLAPAIEKADDHARPDLTLGRGDYGGLFGGEPDESLDPKCVIASVQTLQGRRLRAWPPGHFDTLIIDEAHHATAESYRAIREHLKPRHVLGVTATWDRGDKAPLIGEGQAFETLAFEYSLMRAVEMGYLARPWFEMLPCDVDLNMIRTTAGDLNAGDLEAAIKPHVQALVNTALPFLRDRRFIAFTPDVGSADLVASAFSSVGISCESVSGACHDRDETIAAFRSGRFRGLANCALLTEGFDAPFVDAIVMMRPTKSRALFTQMVGRGTRTFTGKRDCLVIGYNWKTFTHSLVRPVEIFNSAGNVPEETLAGAQKLVESGECKDLSAAVKRAEKDRRERVRLRLQIEEEARRVKGVRIDPLAVDGDEIAPPPAWDSGASSLAARATPGQIAALERAGFKGAEVVEWSKSRASGVLSGLAQRREKGLSSHKQIQLLKRLGFPKGSALTFDAASAMIEELLGAKRSG